MIVLGVNGAYHETAAAVVVDGRLVAAAEEVRFVRRKHGKPATVDNADVLPLRSIAYCLAAAGVGAGEVDLADYYPGDDVVDVVDYSLHDFDALADAPVDGDRFTRQYSRDNGPSTVAAFAASRGKPLSLSGWGLIADRPGPGPWRRRQHCLRGRRRREFGP